MTEHKYAMCFICTDDVYAESLDDVHCLWDDNGWSGRPICFICYCMLREILAEKIDVPITRKKPKKIGLEKWI